MKRSGEGESNQPKNNSRAIIPYYDRHQWAIIPYRTPMEFIRESSTRVVLSPVFPPQFGNIPNFMLSTYFNLDLLLTLQAEMLGSLNNEIAPILSKTPISLQMTLIDTVISMQETQPRYLRGVITALRALTESNKLDEAVIQKIQKSPKLALLIAEEHAGKCHPKDADVKKEFLTVRNNMRFFFLANRHRPESTLGKLPAFPLTVFASIAAQSAKEPSLLSEEARYEIALDAVTQPPVKF